MVEPEQKQEESLFDLLAQAFEVIDENSEDNPLPKIIYAYTTKGAGVSFMENNIKFHHYVPKNAELIAAMQELQSA